MRNSTTSMTAGLAFAAALASGLASGLASAQVPRERAGWRDSELSLFGGVAQGEQLNSTASPLTFRGLGYDAAIDYARAPRDGRFMFAVSLDGGMRSVATIAAAGTSAAVASERVSGGKAGATLLRRFARDSAPRSFGFGVAATIDLSLTAHRYADPTRQVADFLAGFAMVGPAAAWREQIAGGSVLVQITTPLVALADHPYSDTRSGYSPTSIRIASLGSLRGLNGSVTYAPAESRRVGVVYSYRFALLDYADVQPLRSASQSLTVGIVTRFGRGSR